jgi:excinuclease ABC subunit C
LRVLQQARDEAHRFAITFQRKRRSLRTVTSELLRIRGVGDAKRRQLLEAFGSLQGVREASLEAIAALPGFGMKSAQKVFAGLHDPSPAPTAPNADVTAPETGTEQAAEAPPIISLDQPPTSS